MLILRFIFCGWGLLWKVMERESIGFKIGVGKWVNMKVIIFWNLGNNL